MLYSKKSSVFLVVLMAVAVFILSTTPTQAATEISTCEEFQNINNNLTASYLLTQDIDCSGESESFTPIGNSSSFSGSLDGQGYTVNGVMVSQLSTYVGIFNTVGSSGIIRNVGFTNVNVVGNTYVGGVVGINYGTIENVYVTGSVTALDVYSGGFAGLNSSSGTISNSYSLAETNVVSGVYAAGFTPVNFGTVENVYAAGSLSASSPKGIAVLNSDIMTNAFWDTETTGTSSSDGGTGKTTTEMKTQSTFTDWDFTNIWGIDTSAMANNGYPYLRIQGPQVTNVTSTTADGLYGIGSSIEINVTFSEDVTSTGNVTVTLETGATDRTCAFTVYMDSTGSCTYTIQAGDATDDLIVNSVSGTIVADATSYPLWDTTPQTNLADNKTLIIETTAPSITLTATDLENGGESSASSITFTAEFSETVSGFTEADIVISNATVSDFTEVISGTEYTFVVSPNTEGATVTVDVAANAAEDIAGNPNAAASQFSFTYIQSIIITITISDNILIITLNNGETVQFIPFAKKKIQHYDVSDDSSRVAVVGNGRLKMYSDTRATATKKIGSASLKKSETMVKIKKLYNNYESVVVLTPGKMMVWRLTDNGKLKKKAVATFAVTEELPTISFKKKKKHISLKSDGDEKRTWKLTPKGKLKPVK